MSEILSFEEFVSKRNEARAVIKDYVIDCYIKKVKEKLLEENPGISQRQLKMKTRQARDSFKDSAKCRELMEAVPLENVSKSLRKAYDTYCEATKKFIAYEKMKKDVVEAIPEQIKDAYPKARLLRRKFILHIGPTNSGKTFAALEKFREAREAVYLAPLRLLALEVYEKHELCRSGLFPADRRRGGFYRRCFPCSRDYRNGRHEQTIRCCRH